MELIYDGSMDSRLFKDVLGKTIRELSEQDKDFIYLDADLMSCIGTGACYTGPRWQDVVTAWQYTSRNPTPYCDDCIEVQFNKLATGVSSINGAAWVDSNCNKVPAPARSCGAR